MTWLQQLAQRRLLLVSGAIAFLVGSSILRTAESISSRSYWRPVLEPPAAQFAFWLLLLYAFIWIIGSLLALHALSRKEELRQSLASHPLMQQPLLVQIVTFVTHWILATAYVFLTADITGGILLSGMGVVHILLALLLAPFLIRNRNA